MFQLRQRGFNFLWTVYLLFLGVVASAHNSEQAGAPADEQAAHKELFKAAKALFGDSRGDAVVYLPLDIDRQLQSYYGEIFDKLRLTGEEDLPRPKFYLVQCTGAAAFVLAQLSKNHIYVCLDYLYQRYPVEVDGYIVAHELTHFDQGKVSDPLLREYDADARGVVQRLLRMGERDPVTGEPQGAPFNIDVVIKFLNTSKRHSKDHMAQFRLGAALEIALALQRYIRKFPEPSPSGEALAPVIKYLTENWQALPKRTIEIQEIEGNSPKELANVSDLLERAFSNPYEQLRNALVAANDYIQREGQPDFVELARIWIAIDKATKAIIDYERNWKREGSSWEQYIEFHSRAIKSMAAAMDTISETNLKAFLAVSRMLFDLSQTELKEMCSGHRIFNSND